MAEQLRPDLARISDDCVRIVDEIMPADTYDDYTRTVARQHATVVALGAAEYIIDLINDEQEQAEVVDELRFMDPITNIKNRLGFERDLSTAAYEAQQSGAPLTIVTLDLNNIDVINEREGRKEGDRWIRATASVLSMCDEALASRWGGDEYSVVLPNYDEAATDDWWQDTNNALAKAGINAGAGTVTLYFKPGADTANLVNINLVAADRALMSAKAESKSCGQNCMTRTPMVEIDGV